MHLGVQMRSNAYSDKQHNVQYCIHGLGVRASIPNDSGMTMRNILAEGANLTDAGSLHWDLEVNGFSHVHLLVKQLR